MQLYLLSVKELLEQKEEKSCRAELLSQEALQMLDEHRLQKAEGIKNHQTRMQAVGAGLLLQYAVQKPHCAKSVLEEVSVTEIMHRLTEPVKIEYVYNSYGKPDFAESSRHFSLSHSGEYVCLVIGESPVGVDIQRMGCNFNYRLAEKFFSDRELAKLQNCIRKADKAECFFDIWVKKEAYAKLTGEGIGRTIYTDTEDGQLPVCWQMYGALPGYRLAVCTAIREMED